MAGSVSAMDLCLLREALAQESTEAETALALQGLGAYPILQAGRAELVAEWIPRVARGEAVAAFALTEPEHGSDAGALELRAEPDGEGWTAVRREDVDLERARRRRVQRVRADDRRSRRRRA